MTLSVKAKRLLRIKQHPPLALASVLVAISGPALANGPTSTLYFTSTTYSPTNFLVFGGTTTAIGTPQRLAPLNLTQESAIAVFGGRIATSQYDSTMGSVYDANFTYVSGLTTSMAGENWDIFDGTTDGKFNYGIQYGSGDIKVFNTGWGGTPTLLFTATGASPTGIAYDPLNNSLWTSDYNDGTVRDYSMGGTLLYSFQNGYSQGLALAYDPADNTLWMLTQWGTGNFAQ